MTERHEKTADLASFKANETAGEFEAIVSVFGNVDHGGDRVVKGAFTKSLAAWEASGDPIPVLWNHDRANPLAHIGKVTKAEEVDDGLKITAALDVHKPFAKQVYDLLAERRVKEFSFAYEIVDAEQTKDAFELKELNVIEVGPTLQGMNPATQLLAVKSYTKAEHDAGLALIEALDPADRAAVERTSQLLKAQVDADEKAGARLSKETRSAISQAIDLLASLIAVPDDETPKSLEAQTEGAPQGQAEGAASEDSDLITRLQLLKEQ